MFKGEYSITQKRLTQLANPIHSYSQIVFIALKSPHQTSDT